MRQYLFGTIGKVASRIPFAQRFAGRQGVGVAFCVLEELLFDENETAESVKPADHFALQDSNISTTRRRDISKCY